MRAPKPLRIARPAEKAIQKMPPEARARFAQAFALLVEGFQPGDFKPMPSVGAGVYEVRVRTAAGAFRAFYLTRRAEAIYVLHAFEKKTQQTPRHDIETGRQRLADLPPA